MKCREPWHSTLKFWPKVSPKKSENSDFEHLGLRTVLYRVTYAKCDFDTYTEILSRGSKIDKLEVGPTGLICVRFLCDQILKVFLSRILLKYVEDKTSGRKGQDPKGIIRDIFCNFDFVIL